MKLLEDEFRNSTSHAAAAVKLHVVVNDGNIN